MRAPLIAVAVAVLLAGCVSDTDDNAEVADSDAADAVNGADPTGSADDNGRAPLSDDERLDQIWTAAEGWQAVWARQLGEQYGGIEFDPTSSPALTLNVVADSEAGLSDYQGVVNEFPFPDELQIVAAELSLNDRLLDHAIARNRGTLGQEPVEAGEAQEPNGYKVDAPAQIQVRPPVLVPGDDMQVTFPTALPRGVGFSLERYDDGRWVPEYYLSSGENVQGGTPGYTRADEHDNGADFPSVAVSGPGPDVLPVPDDIDDERWRLCVLKLTSPCTEIEVATDQ